MTEIMWWRHAAVGLPFDLKWGERITTAMEEHIVSLGTEEEAYKTKNDEMISVLYIPELYNRERNGVG